MLMTLLKVIDDIMLIISNDSYTLSKYCLWVPLFYKFLSENVKFWIFFGQL